MAEDPEVFMRRAGFTNHVPEYVASRTLETVDAVKWPGSELLTSDLHQALDDLRRRPGKNTRSRAARVSKPAALPRELLSWRGVPPVKHRRVRGCGGSPGRGRRGARRPDR